MHYVRVLITMRMATHECSGCLQQTIQGAMEVDATLVLPNSICAAPGGRHTWARKGDYLQPLYFIEHKQ
jgi:hypothetical protein